MKSILFLVFFSSVCTPFVFADELFIPDNMILSEKYSGVFIRSNDTFESKVRLVSDSDVIDVSDYLILPAGKSHATFDVVLRAPGTANVLADNDGIFSNSTVNVFDSASSKYNLLIVSPDKTSASDLTIGVYIVDDLLNPIISDGDLTVHLSSRNVKAPKSIVIQNGTSHFFFQSLVFGDATISAYTNSALSSKSIEYVKSAFRLNTAVVPDVIAANSFAYLFTWITDGDDNLIRPPFSIPSKIMMTQNNVVSTDASFSSDADFRLQDGMNVQKIFSNLAGKSTVTVSVAGIGTSANTVSVVSSNVIADPILRSVAEKPNAMRTFVMPPATDSNAYLVVSMYHLNGTDVLPVYGEDNSEFAIISQNLDHVTFKKFQNDAMRSQSMIIPVSGHVIGGSEIFVSSSFSSSNATLKVTETPSYTLLVTSLPSVGTFDEIRPLFALSVLNSDDVVVDPHFTFGDVLVKMFSDNISFASNTIRLEKPVTIVYGKSDLISPSVSAVADQNISAKYVGTTPSNFSVDIQTPKSVVSGEPFPAYANVISEGKPISVINKYLQSDCEKTDFFICLSPSRFTVFENGLGLTVSPINVILKEFESNRVSLEYGGDILHIGTPKIIKLHKPSTASVQVSSGMKYDIANDRITLYPTTPGQSRTTVRISDVGYSDFVKTIDFAVKDNVLLDVTSESSDGSPISATMQVTTQDYTQSYDIPSSVSVLRTPIHVEFPQSLEKGTGGFVFDHIEVQSKVITENSIDFVADAPLEIKVVYKKTIKITVNGGIGGGLYSPGEKVKVNAMSRDVAWFLVRDVFDRWDRIPLGGNVYDPSLSFIATENFETSVVYREDYSGMTSVLFVAFVAIFAFLKREKMFEIWKNRKE